MSNIKLMVKLYVIVKFIRYCQTLSSNVNVKRQLYRQACQFNTLLAVNSLMKFDNFIRFRVSFWILFYGQFFVPRFHCQFNRHMFRVNCSHRQYLILYFFLLNSKFLEILVVDYVNKIDHQSSY